ncbi:MAG TPA: ABC transporter ATP-binding protein, partial [Chloroflexi bacterium]|nr:ABC transporter ATP-binding protein [Chloroflexota bacterium]
MSFGLKQLPISSEQINKETFHILKMMGLSHLAKRNIINLSGGEEQRVALARTIAPSPSLLMLDEPLGALDRRLRDQLLLELRQILQELEQTAIYVTHDQEEA